MSLINCKVELKPRWMKLCILVTNGIENTNANANNIVLLAKTQILMFLLSFYQQKTIKNLGDFLEKDLKGQVIEINTKQAVRVKIQ